MLNLDNSLFDGAGNKIDMVDKDLSENSNLVKCSNCKRIIIAELFDSHECDLPIKHVKHIEAAYTYSGSYKDKKIIVGRGLDGTLYSFIVKKKIPIPYYPSNEILQKDKSDEDFTEPRLISVKYF